MKKIFLFMLAAIMITSCDNFKGSKSKDNDTEEDDSPKKKKKKPTKDEEEDEEEDDGPKKPRDNGRDDEEDDDNEDGEDDMDNEDEDMDDEMDDDEETDDDRNGRGWTNQEKTSFQNECVGEAAKRIDQAQAKTYCLCMLNKFQAKFPSYAEANKKLKEADLNAMAAACNNQ